MNAVLSELRNWNHIIDAALAEGCTAALETDGRDLTSFELQEAQDDLLRLSKGKDAFYDRPATGMLYALWYHGRRVNGLLSVFDEIFEAAEYDDLEITDVGAGTGATAWAAALVRSARIRQGLPVGSLKITELDASSFMLSTAAHLWSALTKYVHEAAQVNLLQLARPWTAHEDATQGRSVLVASYLFDHSDRTRAEDVSIELRELADRCDSEALVVVSNAQRSDLNKTLTQRFCESGWLAKVSRPMEPVLAGRAPRTTAVRKETFAAHGITTNARAEVSFHRFEHTEVTHLFREQVRVAMFVDEQPPWRRLNPEQEAIAESSSDRLVVIGAAGSGKSVVLIEALARSLAQPTVGARSILVTSFNKGVIDQLARWFVERTNDQRWDCTSRAEGHIEFRRAVAPNDVIMFINWDKVPTRLLGVPHARGSLDITASIKDVLEKLKTEDVAFTSLEPTSRLLDPQFYAAEFRRVIFGKSVFAPKDYLEVQRTGRGTGLQANQRKLVWKVLKGIPRSLTQVRIDAYRKAQTTEPRFDEVFIDEGQDFLRADFEIAWEMLRHPKAFVVVDEAQALHVGGSYEKPPSVHGQRFTTRSLKSSYRLPPSVATAVAPIAAQLRKVREVSGVQDPHTAMPTSRRASVVGVRPIVIVGDEHQLADQIVEIYERYGTFISQEEGVTTPTILEWDPELYAALGRVGLGSENSSVKKIKGLERRFVIWSVAKPIDTDEVYAESVYTALTRTSCILVVALRRGEMPAENLEIFKQLDADALLPWSDEARQAIRTAGASLRATPTNTLPKRAGESWDETELSRLKQLHADGLAIGEIAALHQRTAGAIRSKMKKLGLSH